MLANLNFDGQTSTQAQPIHIFGKSGEYNVFLIASNPTTASAMVKSVTVAGLSGIEPRRAGNVNAVFATIMDGDINEKTDIKLVRGQSLMANGNMCDILLPRQYRAVTIIIYTTDGRTVSQQSGNGQQFSVFVPTPGNNIVEVNADGE